MADIISYFNPFSTQHKSCAEFIMENRTDKVKVVAITALATLTTLGIGSIPAFRWAAHRYAPTDDPQTLSDLNQLVESVISPTFFYHRLKDDFCALSSKQKKVVVISSVALGILSLPIFGILGLVCFGALSRNLNNRNTQEEFQAFDRGFIQAFEKLTNRKFPYSDTFFEQLNQVGISKQLFKKKVEHSALYWTCCTKIFGKDCLYASAIDIWQPNTHTNASKISHHGLSNAQYQQKIDEFRIALLKAYLPDTFTVETHIYTQLRDGTFDDLKPQTEGRGPIEIFYASLNGTYLPPMIRKKEDTTSSTS